MKYCRRCGKETDRYANGKCTSCSARYRTSNKEQRSAASRWRRLVRPPDPVRDMLRHAQKRAKQAGVDFTLLRADVVIPERCPWLGIPLSNGDGKLHDGSPSLDRIIPEIGYVRGNVIVISHLANRIKNSATPEQLARVLKGLRSVYPKWLLID